MKDNVLVFPCGSEIGLEVYHSLCFSTHFKLYGGSSVNDHGQYVYKNYIEGLPFVDDPDFVTKINNIVDDKKIRFIIPAHDSVVLKLAQAKARGELHCEVITSRAETCETCRSKLRTYQTFENIIPTPKIYKDEESVQANDLPVFLKPDVGQGSKGTYLAKNSDDIGFYLEKDPSLLILEYLPGKEFTVDCFTTKDGKLIFSQPRERIRIQNGISVNSAIVSDQRFSEMAQKINDRLSFRGVWFFQAKENKSGGLVLMEIAPRIAGTMGLERGRGVNLVLLSLFDAMGYDVQIFANDYDITIDRGLENKFKHNIKYSHVYLDFDDLVIFEDKVNPQLMAFIYQCINRGINLHLITRHREVIDETLKKHRLSGVFDETISVEEDQEKADFIKESEAIFIDDSFSERQKIHEKCHIPVFDSHSLESLMEPFN